MNSALIFVSENRPIGHFLRPLFHMAQLNFNPIREYEDHYNTVRPHQGIGNKPIGITAMPPSDTEPSLAGQIQCAERLGGLLRHYWREAA